MRYSALQKKNPEVFNKHFNQTSLATRVHDSFNEVLEVYKFTDYDDLQEEFGDLGASVLATCSELNLNSDELASNTHAKIERRAAQYSSLGRKTQVALLGGSFDPIHSGHIAIAETVLKATGKFDEVWLVPCNNSLHGKKLTSAKHRVRMCNLAITDPRIRVFDYEIAQNLGGSTFQLFNRLDEEQDFKDRYTFSFIIGLDNALSAYKWVQWEDLERKVSFVVMPRAGQVLPHRQFWFMQKPHLYLADEQVPEISSSAIRKILLQDIEVSRNNLEYMSSAVLQYINNNSLYTREG